MATTTAVYARVDTNLKESAEEILYQLGITPSSAIQMLYRQIILQRGLPFEPRLPSRKPISAGALSREELDSELLKGFQSAKNGNTYSEDDVNRILEQEFGI